MNLIDIEKAMQKTLDHLKSQLIGVGSSINDSLIGTVKIDVDGQKVQLHTICIVFQKDRKISITPHDPKMVGPVETILKSQGFEAYRFSPKVVVVNVPAPTGEEARKVAAHVRKLGEDAKVSIRNVRRKYRTDENDKDLQKLTDRFVSSIDEVTG